MEAVEKKLQCYYKQPPPLGNRSEQTRIVGLSKLKEKYRKAMVLVATIPYQIKEKR